jgi:hypothetical protein
VGEQEGAIAQTLVETWDGSTWSVSASPNAGDSTLLSVACSNANLCVAVGVFYESGSVVGPVSEVWNGSSWSITIPPCLGTFSATLASVAEAAPQQFVAVGQLTLIEGNDSTETLAEWYR